MKYIIYKRFKGLAICGLDTNLPYGTECYSQDGLIWYNGFPLCRITSENAYLHFAINEDGCGINRGKLTTKIKEKLAGIKILTKKYLQDNPCVLQRSSLGPAIDETEYCKKYPYTFIFTEETQKLWDRIWNDKSLYKYKRSENEEHWLWNHDFYDAPIADLEHIAKLINIKIQQGDK